MDLFHYLYACNKVAQPTSCTWGNKVHRNVHCSVIEFAAHKPSKEIHRQASPIRYVRQFDSPRFSISISKMDVSTQ